MKILFEFDEKKCSACGACAVACMDQNDVDVAAGQEHYRKVYQYESGDDMVCISIACLHCPDAPCVTACPVGCLYKDPETGLTLYNTQYCIGCHSCAMACPFGAPTFGPDGKMRKCDGCIDRLRAGLDPACVRSCTFGALQLVKADEDPVPPEHSLVAQCRELAESQK